MTLMSNVHQPCKIIGIGINSRGVSQRGGPPENGSGREPSFGLPACDVFRDGPDELVEAVIRFKNAGGWQGPLDQ